MKNIIKIISYLTLTVMTLLAVLVLAGQISMDTNKIYMLILSVVWFVTAPVWILEKKEE